MLSVHKEGCNKQPGLLYSLPLYHIIRLENIKAYFLIKEIFIIFKTADFITNSLQDYYLAIPGITKQIY